MSRILHIVLFCSMVHAAQGKTLEEYRAVFDRSEQGITEMFQIKVGEMLGHYRNALAALESSLKQAGDVDGVLAVKRELERVTNIDALPEGPDAQAPAALQQLQMQAQSGMEGYSADRDAELAALLVKYLKPLESLKKKWLIEDQLEKAHAVNDEVKRVEQWLAEIKSDLPQRTRRPVAAASSGFQPLFNGTDLDGWKVEGKGKWGGEQGLVQCKGQQLGWLHREELYQNFHLKLEYRLGRKANSGVFIHVPEGGDPVKDGLEIQLMDDDGKAPTATGTGSIYGLQAPSVNANLSPGQWNTLEIISRMGGLEITMNGKTIVAVKPESTKFRGLKTPGRIGLQSHTGEINFRNILIKTR
ncbi:MAG: hypothetical protein ACI97B_001795 [Verrucomicrobiales bacterium]|jgi:hypothetical protein